VQKYAINVNYTKKQSTNIDIFPHIFGITPARGAQSVNKIQNKLSFLQTKTAPAQNQPFGGI
jgi:hypothetical protein